MGEAHHNPAAASAAAGLRRYAELLDRALPPAPRFDPSTEAGGHVQVERGLVYAAALRDPRQAHLFDPPPPDASRVVVDRLGHRRPAYRGLLTYAWVQALRLGHETLTRPALGRWEEAVRPWCESAEADAVAVDVTAAPAAKGGPVAAAAWAALALHAAGQHFARDAWQTLAADTFARLARGQQASGAFLVAARSDNPEPWWYHELVLLHAVGSYGAHADDAAASAAAARAAEFHQNETQPDHASAQPWGLFPMIRNPLTRPLADQILHAATTQHPAGLEGVSLMLAADALYCLRLFLD